MLLLPRPPLHSAHQDPGLRRHLPQNVPRSHAQQRTARPAGTQSSFSGSATRERDLESFDGAAVAVQLARARDHGLEEQSLRIDAGWGLESLCYQGLGGWRWGQ